MFCLDTNAVIAVIGKHPESVNARLQNEFSRGTRIIIPAIVLHELLFGVAKSTRRVENRRVLDQFLAAPVDMPVFDANDAGDAAEIRAWLQGKGTPIGP
jgi:tRNA(fMet)-specific endonuclease VapC